MTPDWLHRMARYNAWQNRNLTGAAATLDEAALQADRGAFFGSIPRTFSHLLWADQMWMSRLAGGEKPKVGVAGSATLWPDWAELLEARAAMDARILDWAATETAESLAGDLTWFSGLEGREVTLPRAVCITHVFNHQTHHRGQIHAMLTAAGARPGDTDFFMLPPE